MTYSLKTLTSPSAGRAPAPVSAARFAHETILILGMLALLFWLLALLSYSARDAAWSTSGAGGAVAANCGPGWPRWRAGCGAAVWPPSLKRGLAGKAAVLFSGAAWCCC